MRISLPDFTPRRRPARTIGAALASFTMALAMASGVQAQDWRLSGLGGQDLTPAGIAQGNVIVVTWATWSPAAKGLAPRVNALEQRWSGKAKVYTVNFQEDAAKVRSFVSATPFNAPVLLDLEGTFSRSYSIANLPGLLVLKNGQVAYRGKLPDDSDGLLAGLLP